MGESGRLRPGHKHGEHQEHGVTHRMAQQFVPRITLLSCPGQPGLKVTGLTSLSQRRSFLFIPILFAAPDVPPQWPNPVFDVHSHLRPTPEGAPLTWMASA